jgi:hypothetical protein
MPGDFDNMQRRAMGILSNASQKVMGKVSLAYQTIKNAYETGDLVDYLTASSVFNALPGGKRNQIGHTAFEQAREAVGKTVPDQAPAELSKPAQLAPVIEPSALPRPRLQPLALQPLALRPLAPEPMTAHPAPIPAEERPAEAASNVFEILPSLPKAPAAPTVAAPIERPKAEPTAPRAPAKPTTEKVWGAAEAPKVAALPAFGQRGNQTQPARPAPNRTPRPSGG